MRQSPWNSLRCLRVLGCPYSRWSDGIYTNQAKFIMTKTLFDCIEENFAEYSVKYRLHSTRRMFQRDIVNNDVEYLLVNGNVIEQYVDDFPFPSLLLNGQTANGRALHVVVGVNNTERQLIIITTYEPDPRKWTNNFSRRVQ